MREAGTDRGPCGLLLCPSAAVRNAQRSAGISQQGMRPIAISCSLPDKTRDLLLRRPRAPSTPAAVTLPIFHTRCQSRGLLFSSVNPKFRSLPPDPVTLSSRIINCRSTTHYACSHCSSVQRHPLLFVDIPLARAPEEDEGNVQSNVNPPVKHQGSKDDQPTKEKNTIPTIPLVNNFYSIRYL